MITATKTPPNTMAQTRYKVSLSCTCLMSMVLVAVLLHVVAQESSFSDMNFSADAQDSGSHALVYVVTRRAC